MAARYTTRPRKPASRSMKASGAYDDYSLPWPEADTGAREVHDDGSWSEDRPTGILDASGAMIYRVRNSIGFLADL